MSLARILSMTVITSLTLSIGLSGCASAEKSAAMVIDNASSALRSGEEKVWIDPDATPTPLPRD